MSAQGQIKVEAIPDEFQDWLTGTEGYAMALPMGDGMWAGIKPLLFHWTLHVRKVSRTFYCCKL